MMNYLWIAMVLISIVCALVTGNVAQLSTAAFDGAKAAAELCITLAGIICLWSGLMKVIEKGGLMNIIARLLSPVFRLLFKNSHDKPAMAALSANQTANLLGLGSAATPFGIEAAKKLHLLEPGTIASDDLCTLVVLNSSSIQLIPATVGALRATLGSTAPFDILPAVWFTSAISVVAGLLAARMLRRAFPYSTKTKEEI